MKTINIKALVVVGCMIAMGIPGKSKASSSNPELRNFPEVHAAIRYDLERAKRYKGEIRCLKDELKSDRAAGLKVHVATDKEELKISKSALATSKANLRADKKDLKQKYRLEARERKDRICGYHKAVNSAEKDLKKTKVYGNQASINRDAAYLAHIKFVESASIASLEGFKADREYDMAMVKDDIREFKPQVATIFRSSNPDAYAGNCVVR